MTLGKGSDEEIRNIFRYERLMALDTIRSTTDGSYMFVQSELDPEPNTWDRLMQRAAMRLGRPKIAMMGCNRRFDEMEQRFFGGLPEPEIEWIPTALSDLFKRIFWNGYAGTFAELMDSALSVFTLTSCNSLWTSPNRHQTDISLNRFMFALEAYRRDHDGNYPAALADLRERYLEEIPLDPFSGEAFRYVLEESGFLLYSVGPNGIDEEGRGNGDEPKGDDIRRRMPIAVPPTEPEA